MDQTQAIRTITAAGKNGTMEAPLTASQGEKMKVFAGMLAQREFAAIDFVIDVEAGVTPEDLLNGAFWGGVAQNLKPFNRIEVRADDGTWMCELLVLTASRAWASVKVLQHYNLSTVDVEETEAEAAEPFFYQYKGRTLGHCVIRRSDSEIVHSNAENQAAAREWLKQRLKAGV